MKIGFVGLGQMGTSMARNLLKAGHEVTVYNRTVEKAEELKSDGARVARSPRDAAQGAEAVLTMLANDAAVEAVVLGDDGIAAGLEKGAAHISCSTISVPLVRQLSEEHTKRGQLLISAPVFGRPEAAAGKKLIVAAAGEQAAVKRFTPLFEAIGRRTFIAGSEPWNANAFKVCGNFMIMSLLETFGEAFATLRKAGLDHSEFLQVMLELFGSPVYQNYGTMIAEERYEPAGFALKLGLKDATLVLGLAQELNAPMPIASLIRDHYLTAMANGQADKDWSSLAQVVARNAGLAD